MADVPHKLARNYSSIMEKILQAFSDIADVLPRLDRLKATFPNDTNFNQVVGLIFSDIIEFHQRTYKFFRRKTWHIWFSFDWGLFERRFKSILQKLAHHCDLLDKEATAAHFSEMKQFRDKRQLEEDTFEQQRRAQMSRDVFQWLSAAEDQQEDNLRRICDNRQSETCNWILKDPQMQPWIEDDSSDAVLWMTGIPGAGKSYLCSLLVQYLLIQQRFSTLYYFCSHQSSSGNTCAMVLRTLAYQLLQQNLDMTPLVHQAFLQKGSNRSGPVMKRLLIQILPASKAARIVLDGIDEGGHETQKEVLKSLVEVQKSAGQYCKLLVCSRDEPQIQKSLVAKSHLRLGEKAVEDLRLYIKERINVLQANSPEMGSTLLNLAEQRLHSKAKGMFLWVKLVTDMLHYQTTKFEFEQAIDQLPEGLDEAYGLIQSRIDALRPVQRRRAFSILYWLCVTRRPISIHEVEDGIALHPGQTALNKTTTSQDLNRDIVELCAPLLQRSKQDILDLVHFSAKEYFVHEQSGPFIDVAEAHLNVGISCVINLTSCLDLVPRNTDVISEEELETRVVQGCYGLHSYGQEFWAEHVLACAGTMGKQKVNFGKLIDALEAFAQVWKHRAHADVSLSSPTYTAEVSLGLKRLQNFPASQRFISGWLQFQSEFNRIKPSLNTWDDEEEWRLRKDGTFLSLIDSRLRTITERLLIMQSSRLPSHIDEDDFKGFVSRFSWLCRFQGCDHHFSTIEERESHEVSHTMSFPCTQCDFSARGFRSPKELERHTQKYHMAPEDFEIPEDLRTLGRNFTAGQFQRPFTRPRCWNDRGRRALAQSFRQVVARLESEAEKATGDAGEVSSKDALFTEKSGEKLSRAFDDSGRMMSLDTIRQNVKDQKYGSLAEFKNDIILLSGDPAKAYKTADNRQIEFICDEEIEKALSSFPDFARLDHIASDSVRSAAMFSDGIDRLQGNVKDLTDQMTELPSSSVASFGTRVQYWSLPDEQYFLKLLEQFGRNWSKIADLFITKTSEEVSQHFVQLSSTVNRSLSDLADIADARLHQEALSLAPTMESTDADTEMQEPNDIACEKPSDLLSSSQPFSVGQYLPQTGNSKNAQPPIPGTKRPLGTSVDSGKEIHGPIRKKRRPRPRILCPHCSRHKHGLRDEYAVEKHIERFHTATRKVWICEDISADKNFLTKCKPCSKSKRYGSKHNARNHLRKKHFFDVETSVESLSKWLRETEEPNPHRRRGAEVPQEMNMERSSANQSSFELQPPNLQAEPLSRDFSLSTILN